MITCNGFELESPNLAANMHLEILSAVVENEGVIDLDLQGHLAISVQETAFNILYTDLGLPRGVTHPKCVLVLALNWIVKCVVTQFLFCINGLVPDCSNCCSNLSLAQSWPISIKCVDASYSFSSK